MSKTASVQSCRRKQQKTEQKTKENVIHTMLVVTEKHMQDANWVYYPFKNILHGAVSFLNNNRQYLHKCMSCTIGKQGKKREKEKKHIKNIH